MFSIFIQILLFCFVISGILINFFDERFSRFIAFVFSIIVFISSIFLIIFFDFSKIFLNVYQFSFSEDFTLNLILSLDTFSLFFLILTTFLMSLIILSAWKSIKYKIKLFYFLLILIELFLIFAFISFDLFFFLFLIWKHINTYVYINRCMR